MDRVERLREYIDKILLAMPDADERRCAYLHLYGVSQLCALIALKRKLNVELATMAGMLHDLLLYKTLIHENHAEMGAGLAEKILKSLDFMNEDEMDMVYNSIYHHSDKKAVHSEFDEVLKDADALQHYLYNVELPIREKEKGRLEKLFKELNIDGVL